MFIKVRTKDEIYMPGDTVVINTDNISSYTLDNEGVLHIMLSGDVLDLEDRGEMEKVFRATGVSL